jgi:hypothetical protein
LDTAAIQKKHRVISLSPNPENEKLKTLQLSPHRSSRVTAIKAEVGKTSGLIELHRGSKIDDVAWKQTHLSTPSVGDQHPEDI